MKINLHNLSTAFTVSIFVFLASLDNAVIGLFPPLFSAISTDLNIDISSLGIISAINFFVTSVSSVIWGYLADIGKRRNLIIIGTIFWSVSVFLTAKSTSFMQLAVYQVITGIGLGCIGSIGYSVLTDYIPYRWRGTLMSLWGMSQGFGGIAGSVMASVVATSATWRKPFIIISVLGLGFTVLYLFIKEPVKGASEPELSYKIKEGFEYNYSIRYSHIVKIITKKSNMWLIFQGFFLNMTTGTLIWLPTLYASKIEKLGYSKSTALIASGYIFALFQLGGLLSMYFGYLGDKLQRNSDRGRALLGAISISIAMPLYMLMFVVPLKSLSLTHSSDPISILVSLIGNIILNPYLLLMFILAIGATAAQSANIPNWLALLTDVNLPEHRATAFSIANLVSGTGRALGNVFIGMLFSITSRYLEEPSNYIFTMVVFQLFLVPSIVFYLKAAKTGGRDMRLVRLILRRRAR